jgi:uncharacterized membrane protein YkvA (DUF1232 family)
VTLTVVVVAALLGTYAVLVVALVVLGRRDDARAFAGLVPDCVVFFGRLLRDPRVPIRHKALLALVAVYLSSPIDLIPDFVPVAGQLDDLLLVALALRSVLRADGGALVADHWPGPERSRALMVRLAG